MSASGHTALPAPQPLPGLTRLSAGAALARCLRPFARLAHGPATFRARGLALPLSALPRPAPADPAELYRGRFSFAGKTVETAGRIIFDHAEENADWLRALHAFDWLFPLLEADRRLWRVFARTQVSDWRARKGRLPAQALEPAVTARRVINWIAAAPRLLEGATEEFSTGFFRSLTQQVRRLARISPRGLSAGERLAIRMALAHAGLGLAGLEHLRASFLSALCAELEHQILPDGGHVSRSPARLLETVLDLIPLRDALAEARLAAPAELSNALERAMPMLRFFRHGDGGLALFNGVSDTQAGRLAAALRADAVCGRPLGQAPHSGYIRLRQGPGLLIADCGRPPAPGAGPDAALSVAAFEFSFGAARIITNCGFPRLPSREWRRAARRTAAHSAAAPEGEDAGRIVDNILTEKLFGGPALSGPARLQARRSETPQGALAEITHDAFAPATGLFHTRRLFLSPDGLDLRGEDIFLPAGEAAPADAAWLIRFHLHPSVTATMARDGGSAMLVLPDKSAWRFSARNGRLRLEESVFLASAKGLRRTRQIVIEAHPAKEGASVNWLLRRMSATPRRKARDGERNAPELPLWKARRG